MRTFTALAALACAVVIGLAGGCGGSSSSAASPEDVSAQLAANDAVLRQAIDAWRATGDPPATPPPQEAIDAARFLQSTTRYLAAHPNLAAATTRLLADPLAAEVADLVGAARALRKLSHGTPNKKLKVGPPRPLAELRSYYDAGESRYGIDWSYLAAIHLVETKFGKVKSNSVAGAKGPMQFIPSTWKIYGRGGDIQDPHDAILAAANLLRHNGAPGSYGRALHAYNPSGLYVDAVVRYARVIARDAYAVHFLYCWEP
jgi:membrane-bound lytic murein transglycosylase B